MVERRRTEGVGAHGKERINMEETVNQEGTNSEGARRVEVERAVAGSRQWRPEQS